MSATNGVATVDGLTPEQATEFLDNIPARETRTVSTETRSLFVELTDERKEELGKALAEVCIEHRDEKEEKARVAAEYGSKLKSLETRIHKISTSLESGREETPIVCEWRHDYTNSVKQLVRTDNEEVIESAPLAAWDKQLSLDDEIDIEDDDEDVTTVIDDDMLDRVANSETVEDEL